MRRLTQFLRKRFLMFALPALFCSAASADALLLPGVNVLVGDTSSELPLTWELQKDGITWAALLPKEGVEVPNQYKITSMTLLTDSDPYVAYAFGLINISGSPANFSFLFTTPYVGGPYDTLRSTHSDSFTNNVGNTFTLGLHTQNGKSFIHQPNVNGADLGGINKGCTVTKSGSFSGNCESGTTVDVPGLYAATGTLSVLVSFNLSAGDGYSANGKVELLNTVPEPATCALIGGALIGLCLFVKRSR
jgi:hypothetical protein